MVQALGLAILRGQIATMANLSGVALRGSKGTAGALQILSGRCLLNIFFFANYAHAAWIDETMGDFWKYNLHYPSDNQLRASSMTGGMLEIPLNVDEAQCDDAFDKAFSTVLKQLYNGEFDDFIKEAWDAVGIIGHSAMALFDAHESLMVAKKELDAAWEARKESVVVDDDVVMPAPETSTSAQPETLEVCHENGDEDDDKEAVDEKEKHAQLVMAAQLRAKYIICSILAMKVISHEVTAHLKSHTTFEKGKFKKKQRGLVCDLNQFENGVRPWDKAFKYTKFCIATPFVEALFDVSGPGDFPVIACGHHPANHSEIIGASAKNKKLRKAESKGNA